MFLHGLFGQGKNWTTIAKGLSESARVTLVDLPNHGRSLWTDHFSYTEMSSQVAELLQTEGGGDKWAVVGHSMGGKAAMVLALTEPDRVRRLIVADMAPVAYGHSQIGYVRAMQAVNLAMVGRRSDADAALTAEVPDPALRAFLLQSLAFDGPRATWKLNLPALAEQMPRIMGFPNIDARFDRPTLFLTGARSDYVRPAAWPRIRAHFPAARHVELAGAGHWLHAEAPGRFVEAVEAFLET